MVFLNGANTLLILLLKEALCDEVRALDIIHGLSSDFLYDNGFDTVIDRLATIEKRIDALDLKEGEKNLNLLRRRFWK